MTGYEHVARWYGRKATREERREILLGLSPAARLSLIDFLSREGGTVLINMRRQHNAHVIAYRKHLTH